MRYIIVPVPTYKCTRSDVVVELTTNKRQFSILCMLQEQPDTATEQVGEFPAVEAKVNVWEWGEFAATKLAKVKVCWAKCGRRYWLGRAQLRLMPE